MKFFEPPLNCSAQAHTWRHLLSKGAGSGYPYWYDLWYHNILIVPQIVWFKCELWLTNDIIRHWYHRWQVCAMYDIIADFIWYCLWYLHMISQGIDIIDLGLCYHIFIWNLGTYDVIVFLWNSVSRYRVFADVVGPYLRHQNCQSDKVGFYYDIGIHNVVAITMSWAWTTNSPHCVCYDIIEKN